MSKLSKSCRVQLVGTHLVRNIRGAPMRRLSFEATPCEPFGEDQPTAQIELVVTPEFAADFVPGEFYFLPFRLDETPE